MKGDEWKSDGWNWLEMSKNMSNDGLPANFILDVKVDVDQENSTQNIIKVVGRIQFNFSSIGVMLCIFFH